MFLVTGFLNKHFKERKKTSSYHNSCRKRKKASMSFNQDINFHRYIMNSSSTIITSTSTLNGAKPGIEIKNNKEYDDHFQNHHYDKYQQRTQPMFSDSKDLNYSSRAKSCSTLSLDSAITSSCGSVHCSSCSSSNCSSPKLDHRPSLNNGDNQTITNQHSNYQSTNSRDSLPHFINGTSSSASSSSSNNIINIV